MMKTYRFLIGQKIVTVSALNRVKAYKEVIRTNPVAKIIPPVFICRVS